MEQLPTSPQSPTEESIEELDRQREQFLVEAEKIAKEYAVPLEHVMHIFAASEGKQYEAIDDVELSKKLFSPDIFRDGVRFDLVRSMLDLEKSKKEAVIDALTGLFNRGALDIELRRHAEAFERDHIVDTTKPFSFIFVDLDSFKLVNDTFGHGVGDAVLKAVSEKIRSHLRSSDFVARYGGEEIAVIVDGGLKVAEMLAERMRKDIELLDVEPLGIDANIRKNVTASFGVSQYKHTGDIASDIELLKERADKALYDVKDGGGNSVKVADGDISN